MSPKLIWIASSVGTFGIGIGAGFFIGRKAGREESKELIVDFMEELEASKKFYLKQLKNYATTDIEMAKTIFNAGGDVIDVNSLNPEVVRIMPEEKETLDEVVKRFDYASVAAGEPDPVQELEAIKNIFGGEHDVSDITEEEVEARTDEAPYIITRDEYFENDQDFEQITLTWYEGDNVLADLKDDVIDEVESTVGVDNLSRFGHGSYDKNTVYIQNVRTEAVFEIIRSEGKYSVEVLGVLELKHSADDNRRGVRKFRNQDD